MNNKLKEIFDPNKISSGKMRIINRMLYPIYFEFRQALNGPFSKFERRFLAYIAGGKSLIEVSKLMDLSFNVAQYLNYMLVQRKERHGLDRDNIILKSKQILEVLETHRNSNIMNIQLDNPSQLDALLTIVKYKAQGFTTFETANLLELKYKDVLLGLYRAKTIASNIEGRKEKIWIAVGGFWEG